MLEQTQFPLQEKSNPKSPDLLMTLLSSIAFIGMCIFFKKVDNDS